MRRARTRTSGAALVAPVLAVMGGGDTPATGQTPNCQFGRPTASRASRMSGWTSSRRPISTRPVSSGSSARRISTRATVTISGRDSPGRLARARSVARSVGENAGTRVSRPMCGVRPVIICTAVSISGRQPSRSMNIGAASDSSTGASTTKSSRSTTTARRRTDDILRRRCIRNRLLVDRCKLMRCVWAPDPHCRGRACPGAALTAMPWHGRDDDERPGCWSSAINGLAPVVTPTAEQLCCGTRGGWARPAWSVAFPQTAGPQTAGAVAHPANRPF